MEQPPEKANTSITSAPEVTRRRTHGGLLRPHEPISGRAYAMAVIISLVILFGGWSILSYGGFVKPSYFLPTPTQVFYCGSDDDPER